MILRKEPCIAAQPRAAPRDLYVLYLHIGLCVYQNLVRFICAMMAVVWFHGIVEKRNCVWSAARDLLWWPLNVRNSGCRVRVSRKKTSPAHRRDDDPGKHHMRGVSSVPHSVYGALLEMHCVERTVSNALAVELLHAFSALANDDRWIQQTMILLAGPTVPQS